MRSTTSSTSREHPSRRPGENEDLKTKLAAAERRIAELSRAGAQQSAHAEARAHPEPVAAPAPVAAAPVAAPAPVVAPVADAPRASEPESATGMLALAQKLHDDYVRSGQEESDRLVGEARPRRTASFARPRRRRSARSASSSRSARCWSARSTSSGSSSATTAPASRATSRTCSETWTTGATRCRRVPVSRSRSGTRRTSDGHQSVLRHSITTGQVGFVAPATPDTAPNFRSERSAGVYPAWCVVSAPARA